MFAARILCAAFAALLLAAPAATAAPAAERDPAATPVYAFFTKGEQLGPRARDAGDRQPLRAALEELLAGPTEAERALGYRTSVPDGVVLNGVVVRNRVATVDLSREFASGPRVSLQARLAQLVYTATQVPGVDAARVAIDGRPLARLGAIALDPPPRRVDFEKPAQGGPPPPPPPPPVQASALVRTIQTRLIELSYLPAGAADGLLGPQTRHAILAFQGWERLPRDGKATAGLRQRLARAERPRPRTGSGRRIEVSLERQVTLLVEGGRVLRAIHVSTGARSSPTPPGTYRVFRKERMSWSVPYRVWLPWASYFTGGIAFHESPDVPTHPASHGCVRVPRSDAPLVYGFARMDTTVVVAA